MIWILAGVVPVVVLVIVALIVRARGSSPKGFIKKCGGCGSEEGKSLQLVADKKHNNGYLCDDCKTRYAQLLEPDSIRNFWMCGKCNYRILAGTEIDKKVDPQSKCPNCGADVNQTLVNLKENRPIASGFLGSPLE